MSPRTRKPKSAAIYARISLTRDGEDTAGVDRQIEDCLDLAESLGWNVTEQYVDNNQSAMTGRRPAYRRLLDDVAEGRVDGILVWSADRLYRRMKDLEELVDTLGMTPVATVRSGDVDLSTADGRMVARIMGSVAQRESEKMGERISRAHRQALESGRTMGPNKRFGYYPDGTINPTEAALIRDAAAAILDGIAVEAVAREWTAKGVTGARGREHFIGSAVRKILLRPSLAGIATYGDEEVGTIADRQPILDVETWRQVRAILTDPGRGGRQGGKPGSTMLGEIATCAICGGRLSGRNRTGNAKGGVRIHVLTYGCRAGHVGRDREPFEEAIGAAIVAYVTKYADRLRKPARATTGASRAAVEADKVRAKLAAMPALLAGDDAMDPADYAAAVRALRDRLEALESSMAKVSATPATGALIASGDVAAAWDALDDRQRRTVVRELIEDIEVGKRRSRKEPITVNTRIVWKGSK